MIKFMSGLNAIWSICGKDVIAAFDLAPFTMIYDLGGKFLKNSQLHSFLRYGEICCELSSAHLGSPPCPIKSAI